MKASPGKMRIQNKWRILLILSLICTTAFSQSHFSQFEALFTKISPDTLHIYPHTFQRETEHHPLQPEREKISIELAKAMQLDISRHVPLAKLTMDKERKIIAFIMETAPKTSISMYLYSTSEAKFIAQITLASYTHSPGAFEETVNSWITDLDEDGSLDIATYSDLQDFEAPNKLQDNISHQQKYIHYLRDGKLVYEIWDSPILPLVKLRK
ncbi:MAG TPA: hypothetical protein ENJ82_00825 [Bacteroidetes bacterium]|nr:hypothetical protein [Bacteroidota bacterium]